MFFLSNACIRSDSKRVNYDFEYNFEDGKGDGQAENYSDWSDAAAAHDRSTGVDKWKASDDSKHFDNASIRRRLKRLSKLWKAQDNAGLLYALNEGIHGNMDGMGNDRLHQKANLVPSS